MKTSKLSTDDVQSASEPTSEATSRAADLDALVDRFSRNGIRRRKWLYRLRRFLTLLHSSHDHFKRTSDIILALVLIVWTSPLLLFMLLMFGFPSGEIKAGRWCEPYRQLRFRLPASTVFLRKIGIEDLPALWNIFAGHMSFVGPRPVLPGEISLRERATRRRFDVRPGLICTWWIRSRANIAFEAEVDTDKEYVDNYSLRGDLGMMLRALPAMLYGESTEETRRDIRVMDIRVDNVVMSEAIDKIVQLASGTERSQVCFVNADCANIAWNDKDYCAVLEYSELTLADGIGMKLAGKLLRRPIRQNVNGTDLFPRLCKS